MSNFTRTVYDVVRRIPHGRVASYGDVAAILGKPRAARGVGNALRALPDENDVPWWRVINHRGEISIRGVIHGARLQRALLEAEGVAFDDAGAVDLDAFGWRPEPADLVGLAADGVAHADPDEGPDVVGRPGGALAGTGSDSEQEPGAVPDDVA